MLGLWSSAYAAFLAVAGVATLTGVWLTRASVLRSLRWPAVAGLAASLGLSLLTAEAAVRALALLGASYYEETSRYLLDTEPDPLLGYRHRAERSSAYQDVPVEFNTLGLRNGPLRNEGKRVLLLGDSVAFGWGVEAEKTFA